MTHKLFSLNMWSSTIFFSGHLLGFAICIRRVARNAYEGMLKWKSQDITKAKTMQASIRFRNRWPFNQLLLVSVAEAATVAPASCTTSILVGLTIFRAIELQISQVLRKGNMSKIVRSMVRTSKPYSRKNHQMY